MMILESPIRRTSTEEYLASVEFKALAYQAESDFASVLFEVKRARAIWDPDLGPDGGFRCPPGTRYAGRYTDRFGRNCGWTVSRRIGQRLEGLGRQINETADNRRDRRVQRAARRATTPRGRNRFVPEGGMLERLDRAAAGARQTPRTRRGTNPIDRFSERIRARRDRLANRLDNFANRLDGGGKPTPKKRRRERMADRLDRLADQIDGGAGRPAKPRRRTGTDLQGVNRNRNPDGTLAPPRAIPKDDPDPSVDVVSKINDKIKAQRESDIAERVAKGEELPERAWYLPKNGSVGMGQSALADQKRWGKYYDSDGNLNDAGRALNTEIANRLDAPEQPNADAPEPKKKTVKGPKFDVGGLDDDGLAALEQVLRQDRDDLAAKWQKRLGKSDDESFTVAEIKEYLAEREGNDKNSAPYLNTLRAMVSDWEAMEANLATEGPLGERLQSTMDSLSPSRRKRVIAKLNAGPDRGQGRRIAAGKFGPIPGEPNAKKVSAKNAKMLSAARRKGRSEAEQWYPDHEQVLEDSDALLATRAKDAAATEAILTAELADLKNRWAATGSMRVAEKHALLKARYDWTRSARRKYQAILAGRATDDSWAKEKAALLDSSYKTWFDMHAGDPKSLKALGDGIALATKERETQLLNAKPHTLEYKMAERQLAVNKRWQKRIDDEVAALTAVDENGLTKADREFADAILADREDVLLASFVDADTPEGLAALLSELTVQRDTLRSDLNDPNATAVEKYIAARSLEQNGEYRAKVKNQIDLLPKEKPAPIQDMGIAEIFPERLDEYADLRQGYVSKDKFLIDDLPTIDKDEYDNHVEEIQARIDAHQLAAAVALAKWEENGDVGDGVEFYARRDAAGSLTDRLAAAKEKYAAFNAAQEEEDWEPDYGFTVEGGFRVYNNPDDFGELPYVSDLSQEARENYYEPTLANLLASIDSQFGDLEGRSYEELNSLWEAVNQRIDTYNEVRQNSDALWWSGGNEKDAARYWMAENVLDALHAHKYAITAQIQVTPDPALDAYLTQTNAPEAPGVPKVFKPGALSKHDALLPEEYRLVDPHSADGPWGPVPEGKKAAYGLIVVDEDGRILMREPSNHFDGYHWTFPKGKPDPGEHPIDSALREAYEETGWDTEVMGFLPGHFDTPNSSTFFAIARVKNGVLQDEAAWKDNGETWTVDFLDFDKAVEGIGQTTNLSGRERDMKILEAARRAVNGFADAEHSPGRLDLKRMQGDTQDPVETLDEVIPEDLPTPLSFDGLTITGDESNFAELTPDLYDNKAYVNSRMETAANALVNDYTPFSQWSDKKSTEIKKRIEDLNAEIAYVAVNPPESTRKKWAIERDKIRAQIEAYEWAKATNTRIEAAKADAEKSVLDNAAKPEKLLKASEAASEALDDARTTLDGIQASLTYAPATDPEGLRKLQQDFAVARADFLEAKARADRLEAASKNLAAMVKSADEGWKAKVKSGGFQPKSALDLLTLPAQDGSLRFVKQEGIDGIDSVDAATKHLKDGGSIKDIPSEHLEAAIKANLGGRFQELSKPWGINDSNAGKETVVFSDTLDPLGRKYVLKTPTRDRYEHLSEQSAQVLMNQIGLPSYSAVALGDPYDWDNPDKGWVATNRGLLMEHIGNLIEGDVTSPNITQDSDLRNLGQVIYMDWLIHEFDRHGDNRYMVKGPDGKKRLVPIDMGKSFQEPKYGDKGMSMHIGNEALSTFSSEDQRIELLKAIKATHKKVTPANFRSKLQQMADDAGYDDAERARLMEIADFVEKRHGDFDSVFEKFMAQAGVTQLTKPAQLPKGAMGIADAYKAYLDSPERKGHPYATAVFGGRSVQNLSARIRKTGFIKKGTDTSVQSTEVRFKLTDSAAKELADRLKADPGDWTYTSGLRIQEFQNKPFKDDPSVGSHATYSGGTFRKELEDGTVIWFQYDDAPGFPLRHAYSHTVRIWHPTPNKKSRLDWVKSDGLRAAMDEVGVDLDEKPSADDLRDLAQNKLRRTFAPHLIDDPDKADAFLESLDLSADDVEFDTDAMGQVKPLLSRDKAEAIYEEIKAARGGEDLVMWHEFHSGSKSPSSLVKYVKSGGMFPSAERLMSGLTNLGTGQSPEKDHEYGSAAYLFKRWSWGVSYNAKYHDNSIVVDPVWAIQNLGWYASDSDIYGKMTSYSTKVKDSGGIVAHLKANGPGDGAEWMTQGPLVFGRHARIRVKTAAQRQEVIDLLKEDGIDVVDGVPVEQLVLYLPEGTPDWFEWWKA